MRDAARKIGNKHVETNALINTGIAYADSGERQIEINLLREAVAFARDSNNQDDEIIASCYLARVQGDLGWFQDAITGLEAGLKYWRKTGRRVNEGATLCNAAKYWHNPGENSKAKDLYLQAMTIFREAGQRHFEANALSGLGIAYRALGNFTSAVECTQKAAEIYKELSDKSS